MAVVDDAVFAENVEERFHYGAVWYLEGAERRREELGLVEEKAVDLFRSLEQRVDAVPPALMSDVRRLSSTDVDTFELVLQRMLNQTGRLYQPADAADFLKSLVATVRGRST